MSLLSNTRTVDPEGDLWGEGETSKFSDEPIPLVAGPIAHLPGRPARELAQIADWLTHAGIVMVSVRSLAQLGVPNPKLALRGLRRANLVVASSTRGVYVLSAYIGADGHTADVRLAPADLRLACHLHAHPTSPLTWGPRMLPLHEGWVKRPVPTQYCFPKTHRIPVAFTDIDPSRAHRWDVKTPRLWYGMLPCWRYETELVYIAARPGHYAFTDLHDYLWELAHASIAEHLLAELDGQPRSVWMRTCLLLRYGSRRDLAALLLAQAPQGTGPYYFADSRAALSEARSSASGVIWHSDLEVQDALVDRTLSSYTARYPIWDIPDWALSSFEAGRPSDYVEHSPRPNPWNLEVDRFGFATSHNA